MTVFLVFAIIFMVVPVLALIYYIFEVKNLITSKNTIASGVHWFFNVIVIFGTQIALILFGLSIILYCCGLNDFVEDAGTYSDQQCFDFYTNAVFEKVDFQYFVCLLISIIVGIIIVILSILTDAFIIFLLCGIGEFSIPSTSIDNVGVDRICCSLGYV